MSDLNNSIIRRGALLALLAIGGAACQQGAVTVNTNSNTNAANANAGTNANANTSAAATTTFETREPEQYQATLVVTQAATNAGQATKTPTVQIARSGDNRRYTVALQPYGEVVFLDRADKRYLILPTQKKYVELTPEMTGFNLRSLTPGQMIAHLQRQPGVQLVGDDTVNGRAAAKYRYAATAKTGTAAGDVSADTLFYVDKETGLPLKVESSGQTTGSVKGASSGRVVAELRDLQTTVDAASFELPQGYTQITKEQMQQYASALAAVFQFVMGQMNQPGAAAGATPASPPTLNTPAATASPAASASPTAR
jgi:hypothetical protein